MARFSLSRPSRFFRRNTSGKSTTTLNSTQTASTQTANTSSTRSSSRSPASPSPNNALRKSASLGRLRERFLERGAEVPEAVQEQRESVLLGSEALQDTQDADSRPGVRSVRSVEDVQRCGSETPTSAALVVGDADQKSPGVTTKELTLELGKDVLGSPPVVTVEEPTPQLPAGEGGFAPDDPTSQQPSSGEITLAPPGPDSKVLQDGGAETNTAASSRSVSPDTLPTNRTVPRQSSTDGANANAVNTLFDDPAGRHPTRPTTASTAVPQPTAYHDYFTPSVPNLASIMHRKIWVRRPGASATLVQIQEDDLVDDVREMILKKYANSLGRTFDSPDMTLRIATLAEPGQQGQQAHRMERVLGPEEEMCRTIDAYFPGGQTVDDALIIDVPQPQKRHTPKPSPRAHQQASYHGYHNVEDYRPLENGTDYFPPMPAVIPPSMPQTASSHDSRGSQQHHPSMATVPAPGGLDPHQRSIAVLSTGQIPPLPSPGGTRRHREHRPRYGRQHTSSPTILAHPQQQHGPNAGAVAVNAPVMLSHPLVHRATARPRMDSAASEAHAAAHANSIPAPPPLPTPPAPEAPPSGIAANGSSPPTPSQGVATPHQHRLGRLKKPRRTTPEKPVSRTRHQRDDGHQNGVANGLAINSVLDGSVPPINVLIVEDNIINLRILEGLMKRLKVRWSTAMNGQIAVDSWKKGGYHLVLMDIQMPVMNGLQATREIRRLERVNGIGVFSEPESTTNSPVAEKKGGKTVSDGGLVDGDGGDGNEGQANGQATHDKEADKLSMGEGHFKSPVIIVALTASSLQSDRHEALAAGCNDFLTKPVNFVWLERKVKEWGCMQALIDFDGWRRWKDYAVKEAAGKTEKEREDERIKEEKQKVKMEKLAMLQEKQRAKKEEEERVKRAKRQSVHASDGGAGEGAANGSAAAVSASEG